MRTVALARERREEPTRRALVSRAMVVVLMCRSEEFREGEAEQMLRMLMCARLKVEDAIRRRGM